MSIFAQLMNLLFYKYEGAGNDFIVFDNRRKEIALDAIQIQRLCDRHFGIGADGVLLLEESAAYDFEMVYYNADGSSASFCGNGGRCMVAFAAYLGIIKEKAVFVAGDGVHAAQIISTLDNYTKLIAMQMTDTVVYECNADFYYLNTGTYHVVKFVDDLENYEVFEEGRKMRYDKRFEPHGTNVNFVKYNNGNLQVRTYEKGVEDETLACGTGVTASAIAAGIKYGGTVFSVKAKGGDLNVSFDVNDDKYVNITLTGEAKQVFKGNTTI